MKKKFYVGIYAVKSIPIKEILKGVQFKPPDYTRQMVINILKSEDTELQIENTLKVSLLCPLIGSRIKHPGRGTNCNHVQCFDLESYLMMNETKPLWKCPVCKKDARSLHKDNLFVEILQETSEKEEIEITFLQNGTWASNENMKKSESGYLSYNGEMPEKMDTDECINLSGMY